MMEIVNSVVQRLPMDHPVRPIEMEFTPVWDQNELEYTVNGTVADRDNWYAASGPELHEDRFKRCPE